MPCWQPKPVQYNCMRVPDFAETSIMVSAPAILGFFEYGIQWAVSKMHRLTQNDTEWHRMTKNDKEWHRMTENDTEWHRMIPFLTIMC